MPGDFSALRRYLVHAVFVPGAHAITDRGAPVLADAENTQSPTLGKPWHEYTRYFQRVRVETVPFCPLWLHTQQRFTHASTLQIDFGRQRAVSPLVTWPKRGAEDHGHLPSVAAGLENVQISERRHEGRRNNKLPFAALCVRSARMVFA